jgi:hypothetical protein
VLKRPINPVSNPNPVNGHTLTRESMYICAHMYTYICTHISITHTGGTRIAYSKSKPKIKYQNIQSLKLLYIISFPEHVYSSQPRDPPTGRISTTCNVRIQRCMGAPRYHRVTQYEYDVTVRVQELHIISVFSTKLLIHETGLFMLFTLQCCQYLRL